MIYGVFTVYDSCAKAYLPPFILPQVAMAERTFADCVNSEGHQFNAHPDHYTLFQIGTFDDNTSHFERMENGPHPIGNGVRFVKEDITATEGLSNGEDQGELTLEHEPPILERTPSEDPTE